jgi:indolepyruvate ferredoxin oxidoreductase
MRDASLRVPEREAAIAAVVGVENVRAFDANAAAERLLGDSVFANVMMLGFAWQMGLVPVSFEALSRAIELNGVAQERNHAAFAYGRVMAARPETLAAATVGPERPPETYDALVARSADFLAGYQDAAYAARYRRRLDGFRAALPPEAAEALGPVAARALFRLMAYKDEYEVARLHTGAGFEDRVAEAFEGAYRLRYHLAPPFLPAGRDARGRPLKRSFGPWMGGAFRLLAQLRRLRGTPFDPFGYMAERRKERALIGWYEGLMDRCAAAAPQADLDRWGRILAAPMDIRGYGPVKEEAIVRVEAEVAALLAAS